MNSLTTIIGLLAASLTTFGSLPQMIKVIRTKKTTDISLHMYILTTTGVLLWFAYGLIIHDLPLIAANGTSSIFVSTILFYKLKYR